MKKIIKMLVADLALRVIAVGVLGAVAPWTLTWVGPYVSWMLGVVMFGMGMTLRVEDFRNVLKAPWQVGLGVAAQFIIMPLVA